jgi:hypothetical protein
MEVTVNESYRGSKPGITENNITNAYDITSLFVCKNWRSCIPNGMYGSLGGHLIH